MTRADRLALAAWLEAGLPLIVGALRAEDEGGDARPSWMTAARAAELTSAPVKGIVAAGRAGLIESRLVGRARLYSLASVERWIAGLPSERRRAPPSRPAAVEVDEHARGMRPRRARAPRGRAA